MNQLKGVEKYIVSKDTKKPKKAIVYIEYSRLALAETLFLK